MQLTVLVVLGLTIGLVRYVRITRRKWTLKDLKNGDRYVLDKLMEMYLGLQWSIYRST